MSVENISFKKPKENFCVNFAEYIQHFAKTTPEAEAVWADRQSLTYAALGRQSQNLAAFLLGTISENGQNATKRMGIFGDRTLDIAVAVSGAAWAGFCYVPFSLKSPEERLLQQMALAKCDVMFLNRTGLKHLTDEIIAALPEFCIVGDLETLAFLKTHKALKNSKTAALSELPDAPDLKPVSLKGSEDSYIIFTSGSTGIPKGVCISFSARQAYIDNTFRQYALTQADRVAQPVDLAWDVSICNMVCAFTNGAALYYLKEAQLFAPSAFIRKYEISFWCSSPSLADLLKEAGGLKENIFPTLRYSAFIGAPFQVETAKAWQKSAPQSKIYNNYGPTECTVDCLAYEVPADFKEGDVPIGKPYEGIICRIADMENKPVKQGEAGELWLSGTQLATGYLDDAAKTAESFPELEGKKWYRTGDLVFEDEKGDYHFKGRLNNQLKVLGYRVELEDVEAYLRKVTGVAQVAAAGFPIGESAVRLLIAFIVAPEIDEAKIKSDLADFVPPYMIPDRIFQIKEFPLNTAGKLNRKALSASLPEDYAPP